MPRNFKRTTMYNTRNKSCKIAANKRAARRRRALSRKRNFANPNLANLTANITNPNTQLTPLTKKVVLKYGSFKSLEALSGIQTVRFHMNGLYDPDQTGAGHQPMGFDQYMAFYEKYTVHASKIEVEAISRSVNTTTFVSVGAIPTGHSTYVDIDTIVESPNTAYGLLGGYQRNKIKLSSYVNLQKYFGEPLNEDKYEGDTSANPLKTALWDITAIDPTLNSLAVDLVIEITYYCTLKEPVELYPS